MKYVLDSVLHVPKGDVDDAMLVSHEISKQYTGEILSLYAVSEDEYLFPVTSVDLFSAEIIDERTLGRNRAVGDSKLKPREGQAEAIETLLSFYADPEKPDVGLLVAGCGKGKTIMGVEIARKLGTSVCILVHKEYLGEQWKTAIQMLDPGATVGFVRQDKCDTGNEYDYVIASTQSITSPKRVYSDVFYKSFGLLMLDEVHRYGAETWQRSMQKFHAKRRLGLTATNNRFDGMWRVIEAHLGDVIYSLEADIMEFKVYMLSVKTPFKEFKRDWMSKIQIRSALLKILTLDNMRNSLIAYHLNKAYLKGRTILVISDRKAQLESIKDMCGELDIPERDLGVFVGGLSKKKRDEATSKRIILTTYSMSEEGLDIVALDTIFMASPRSHIIQTVGRMLRYMENKKMPLVVDLVDVEFDESVNWAYSRVNEYTSLNANITGFVTQKRRETCKITLQ